MLDSPTALAPGGSPPSGPWHREARDALHSIATLYLKHREPARALTLLLTALHLGPATKSLLLATASAFLDVGQPEQARAALDRVARDFGHCQASLVLKARADFALDGLAAGQATMADALSFVAEAEPDPLTDSSWSAG
ncbi:MAG: hypothetical protein AAFR17_09110 [Pseudomonadota bacterium]